MFDTDNNPIGITPKNIWDAQHKNDLWEAISRYVSAGKDYPYDWLQEYEELVTDKARRGNPFYAESQEGTGNGV